ncbi:MAG: dynamin family protein [Acidimicrobiales bacterium]
MRDKMREATVEVAGIAIQAANAYGREDLAARIEATRARVEDPNVRVMVVGEFKQGKSSLVNALLNAPVCPVDDDVATSVPTLIRYSAEPNAVLVRPVDPKAGPGSDEDRVEKIEFDAVPVYASELGNPSNERGILAVEIGLPRALLADGIVLVDTPGVGGLSSPHTAATMATLPTADVVLFVSDASQELTRAELDFMTAAAEVCPNCAFVLTKPDFYPDWEKIRDLNAGHLRVLGDAVPQMVASATLRHKAIESNDRTLNLESGYPQLIEFVRAAARGVATRTVEGAVAELRSVVLQLSGTFESERQVLAQPEGAAEVLARFETAKERAAELKNQAARWHVTLNDGVADLTADFDHRLRGRLRQTTAEADLALDESEPGKIWEQFEDWLRRRVSQDLAQTYLELVRRTEELSIRVGEHFDDGEAPLIIQLDPSGALATAEGIDPRNQIEPFRLSIGGTAMTAMRGSYGGLLMFGMVANMAGLAMLNPATAAIGLLMGRKAVKDERQRQLTLQRQQAKMTARQFVDDTGFEVGKGMKDSTRRLHRQLRDHYQKRAEELNRSIATSMAAAKQAMNTSQQNRQGRLRDVEAELGRLAGLSARIDGVAATIGDDADV